MNDNRYTVVRLRSRSLGNKKTTGGDPFVPTLIDSRGRNVPIRIVDNNDGTYTVTYLPDVGVYIVMIYFFMFFRSVNDCNSLLQLCFDNERSTFC